MHALPPKFFTIALDLRGRTVVIVGGGSVARRRAEALHAAGARVQVVAPQVGEGIETFAEVRRKPFESSDVGDAFLVLAATDDRAVNDAVRVAARERGVLVNVADDPASGDFIVPAAANLAGLKIAVMTDGDSPAISRLVRERIEREIGAGYGLLAQVLGAVREVARQQLEPDDRRRLYAEIATHEAAQMLERDPATFMSWLSGVLRLRGLEVPVQVGTIVGSASSQR